MYYATYMHKKPCMVSYNTRMRWLNEVVWGHWKRCVNMFMMDARRYKTFVMTLKHKKRWVLLRRW
jgi:hypothetical protein